MQQQASPSPPKDEVTFITALILALANFTVVLDTTIANVSVPHIAGSMAISPSQGTYVITSYAVAEAVIVPLTGWLTQRVGTVRLFIFCIMMFGLCSLCCGLSGSIGALVCFRIFQGLAGGPIMPLSQTLLRQVFPEKKLGGMMALWGATTLLAPIFGPIVGGYISDNWGWPFIFFINLPITLFCASIVWKNLRKFETPTVTKPVDVFGLALMVIWIASVQLALDKGKELGWFDSSFITTLVIVGVLGFIAFMIWELTEEHPIVDLTVYKEQGFTISTIIMCLCFGGINGSIVVVPLWLQNYMGYTATQAGMIMGMTGILAAITSMIVPRIIQKVDIRLVIFSGVLWLAGCIFWRSFYNNDVTFWQLAFPVLIQGGGMVFFFIPLNTLALSSVHKSKTATATGLFSFTRTLTGAFAISIVQTYWDNKTIQYHAEMVGKADRYNDVTNALKAGGSSSSGALATLDNMITSQATIIAINHTFQLAALLMAVSAFLIWFVRKPKKLADEPSGH